ncbi:XRE family transcriptional regulator [Oxalobacteraceae bacterium]|nr:XRE family transcriptional regulator [Oxalobacteraceae bacterium]
MKSLNIGSSFDDFLSDEGILGEVNAVAVKRVIVWQVVQAMKGQKMSKTSLAKKMGTCRASLNRLLDENDASLTLATLASAAAALGKKIQIELVPV